MFYQVEPLFPGLTRIWDVARTAMYLVEGADRAVLIDTGVGLKGLKELVDGLTDKPLTILLTHGHVDHAMGAAEFEEVYMNHADDYIYVQHADMGFRRDGLFLCPQKVEEGEIIPAKELSEIKQMSGGEIFYK